jgi:DNA-binding PadR family transcriptional regulator
MAEKERKGKGGPKGIPFSEEMPALKRVEFLVLLVLADGESHGYRIVREMADRTQGRVSVLPGNLYAVLRRLSKEGLVAEVAPQPAPDLADQRRRYYGITPFGRRVLAAEAEFMRALVQAASDGSVIPEGASS